MSARHLLRRAAVCAAAQANRAALNQRFLGPALPIPRASGLYVNQRFSFATRSAAADSYLVEVLKSEIEHELREESSKQGSLKGSAGPFEISDKAGTEEVILRRTCGSEKIAITCLVQSQYPDEDEEQEGNENDDDQAEEDADKVSEDTSEDVLHLNVNITKEAPMPSLEFECTYERDADEVKIESISFLNEDPPETDGEPQPYTGPDFDDLDETLQKAFHELIRARGLTPKVANYVLDYLKVKEHREYMRWLHNVETFFSSE